MGGGEEVMALKHQVRASLRGFVTFFGDAEAKGEEEAEKEGRERVVLRETRGHEIMLKNGVEFPGRRGLPRPWVPPLSPLRICSVITLNSLFFFSNITV